MLTLIRRLRGERGGVALVSVIVLFFILVFAFAVCDTDTAQASHREVCVTVVDEEAYTEVIPGTPDIWEVFSPNDNRGPFEGPPTWPTDERGTWQEAAENIPPGHAGPDGVYQMGQGNGSWFYRQAGTPDEVIEHPAMTHEKCRPVLHSPEPPQKPEEPKGDVDGPKNAKPLPKDLAFTGPMAAETAAIAAGALIALGLASLWFARRRQM